MKTDAIQLLLKLLKIQFPLIQSPMAGGATTPELVAAVSNSGCLGSIGAGYLSREELSTHIKKTRTLTPYPFAVNLFVPQKNNIDSKKVEKMQRRLNVYRSHLGIPLKEEIAFIDASHKQFEQQMEVVLSHDIPVFSFTFGIPEEKYMKALREKSVVIFGTATNIHEGKMLEEAGCHAIVAQGYEAGGHRGTFFGEAKQSLLGLMAFIPQLVDAVSIPVIAAGGIMDGRGLAASLALGASGAQMGTAFLTCLESGAAEIYKQALLTTTGDKTQLTRAFSGKEARGISNTFIQEIESNNDNPGYPAQHYLTQDIRKAGNPQYMSLWAGQGIGTKPKPIIKAQQKIDDVKSETQETITALNQLTFK